jgi:hypothetical protein
MAVLGKDLIAYSNNFFEFTALFATDGIEIQEKSYKYAEITTAFLNYDCSEYLELIVDLKKAVDVDYQHDYIVLSEKLNELIKQMPLFGDFHMRHNLLQWDYYNPFYEKEKPSNPYRNFDDYIRLADDLKTIRERYTWFVNEMYYRTFPKIETNKYAYQIENNGASAFVSGVSLGSNQNVDPAKVSMQFEVRESVATGQPQLFEKMNFTRLIDFIYMDFLKGLMAEYSPKKCKLCGRYFLQEKGFSYEYCNNIAPNETDKTCREIGSLASFRDKVKNNEIWQIHQRAYKKYYARVLKKKMSKSEFLVWAENAERLRDQTLELAEIEKRDGRELALDNYISRINMG